MFQMIIQNYIDVLTKNYANFKGRVRRRVYWYFVLANVIVAFIIGFIGGLLGTGIPSNIYSLATLVPSICLGIRRIHDTNRSGWFILVPFYNLYLLIIDGDRSENRFGADPKAGE